MYLIRNLQLFKCKKCRLIGPTYIHPGSWLNCRPRSFPLLHVRKVTYDWVKAQKASPAPHQATMIAMVQPKSLMMGLRCGVLVRFQSRLVSVLSLKGEYIFFFEYKTNVPFLGHTDHIYKIWLNPRKPQTAVHACTDILPPSNLCDGHGDRYAKASR